MKSCQYMIHGSLDEKALLSFIHDMRACDLDRDGTLTILLQSGGGLVSVGLAIAQILKEMPNRVVTYNLANVDSAAIPIFAAGDERICPPASAFLVHEIGKEICGVKTAQELRNIIAEIESDTDRIVKFLSGITKMGVDEWRSLMSSPSVLDAKRGLEVGLVTQIGMINIDCWKAC